MFADGKKLSRKGSFFAVSLDNVRHNHWGNMAATMDKPLCDKLQSKP